MAKAERLIDEKLADNLVETEEMLIGHGATPDELDREMTFAKQLATDGKREALEWLARILAEPSAPSVRLQ